MFALSRRDFLRQGTLAAALGWGAWPAPAQREVQGPAGRGPDLVVLNQGAATLSIFQGQVGGGFGLQPTATLALYVSLHRGV